MTTLKDLARQLGLSTSTVSRALAESSSVSVATTNRVRALATKLDYQPNTLGVNLRRGRSRLLGVVVPHLQNNFFPRLVQGVEEAATAAGYGLLICQSGENTGHERRALASLRQAQVEGILVSVARTTTGQEFFAELQQQVPLVFLDRFPEGAVGSAAIIDDRAGGYLATRHLLTQGYRRIAHLAGPAHLSIYRNRWQGYEDALREAGLLVTDELVLVSDLRQPDGEQATRKLLALPTPPDAIFAASDFAALGCLRVLGTQVPAKVGVVGFGDEFFASHTTPALSSVAQRGEALGRAAVDLLLELKKDPTTPARYLVLPPELHLRASSTCLLPSDHT